MPFHFSLVIIALFTCSGCQSLITEPVIKDQEYFPLETGRYVIYDVEEEQFSPNSNSIKRTYQRKEVTGTVYIDVTDETAYRLLRYHRTNDSQPWQADSVWSARLVDNEAIRTENGRNFVKLVFPISDKMAWNGNRHNGGDVANYEARNINAPFHVLTKQFHQTVTVIEQDDSTLVSQDKHMDVYARHVGLIYKERTHIQFCISTPACTGKNQVDYGIRQVYRIRTYGNE